MIDMNYMRMKWDLFKTKFFGDENGAVDLIVIIILIAIVVILAIIFRNQISDLIASIFQTANEDVATATGSKPGLNSNATGGGGG